MADPTPSSDRVAGPEPEHAGVPRWVKVFAVVAVVVIVIVVVANVLGGDHGPGRHVSSGGSPGDAPALRATLPDALRAHRSLADGLGS